MQILTPSAVLPAFLCWLLFAPPCAADDGTRAALATLVERGVIASADEWEQQLVPGAKLDGGKVASLLVKLAGVFKPVTAPKEAVEVLAERGVIGTPEYWNTNAVAGRKCDARNLAILITRAASLLPVPPPPSVHAAPLAPANPSAFRDRYDIVVAGAGTGGCGAAIQAARMGRSVLLLEETDWIGGQMCAAAVTSMDEGKPLVRQRGLYRELCGLIGAHYEPLGIQWLTAYWHHSPAVEPRVGQILLRKMLGDARGQGVLDLVLQSQVSKVFKTGNRVTGVELESVAADGKRTRRVECKVLIDATEWGDIIPLAGARYRTGNSTSDRVDRTKRIQDLTWTAVVKQYPQGVPDELRVKAPPPGYDGFVKRFRQTLILGPVEGLTRPAKGDSWGWNWFIGYRGMPDSSRGPQGRAVTRTHLNYNNDYPVTVADLEDRRVRMETCRKAVIRTLCLLHYIQAEVGKSDWSVANDEGYDSPFNRKQMDAFIAAQPELSPYRTILYHFSIMPYARESRRIIGLHTLTARQIERRIGKPVQFADTVALGDYAVDLHGSMKPEFLELDLDRPDDIPREFGGTGTGPFAIPLRSFIPEKIDGFLPAEKNLSQSRLANGATRLQPHTLNMGQAIGAIAALAIAKNVQPRAVDPRDVQRVLLDAGCTLAIQPASAAHGTAEWKRLQLEILQGKGVKTEGDKK